MSEMAAKGESGVLEITVEASMDQIQTVTDFVNRQLEAYGCPERTRIQLDVAIDEIFGSIVRYAYGSETGSASVRLWMEEETGILHISFIDRGTPFNPLEKEIPDTTGLKARERPIGGLGLLMAVRLMQ